jgi:hypothetical protein
MESPSANDATKPTQGLPPVQPPSGRFIAQLFVIPGLIIFVVVLLYIGSTMLVTREHEPNHFLNQLDNDNAEIRWRGASDLAQILKRREPATLRWKADPKFALDLAERLDLAFQHLLKEEKTVGAKFAASTDKHKHILWRPLTKDRDYLSFLAGALGEFHAPVGTPILCAILKHDDSPDLNGNTLQRRNALLALMNMGDNLKGFTKIPSEQQQNLLKGLKDEASAHGARAGWARTALYYLDKGALPGGNMDGVVRVDETLVAVANAQDLYLREMTAMAFNFWDGDKAEATLLKLTKDDGRNLTLLPEEKD